MNVTKEEIKQFIKDAIEWLVDQDQGCATLKLDDRLAICVGWLDGYDENDEDLIHSKEDPTWGLNAGLKVYTSDDMRTDYEFINSPYYDKGEVVDIDVSLKPNANLDELADYFIKEYSKLENLEIEEDGRIIEHSEDDFENSYETMEDEVEVEQETKVEETDESCKQESCENKEVKESWEGESVIDDLIERAQSMYDEGGYGDIDDCVAQAIDDGLIYTDDIRTLADHYGVLPDDSDLIAEFYDELSSDVYNGIEEHEEPEEEEEEEEEDDWDFEDEEESSNEE